MQSHYQTFKTFPDKETAEDFAEVLKQVNIDFLMEEDSMVFDATYANNQLQKDFRIDIRASEFSKAYKALDEYYSRQLNEIDPDYYLFSFTDEELKEIIAKPDEWGSLDFALSKKILQDKGIQFSEEELQSFREERYNELARPEKEKSTNVLGHYIVGILLPPIGVIIGWVWGYSKKNLPDGQQVSNYNNTIRHHGRIIFTLSIIILLTVVLSVVVRSL